MAGSFGIGSETACRVLNQDWYRTRRWARGEKCAGMAFARDRRLRGRLRGEGVKDFRVLNEARE